MENATELKSDLTPVSFTQKAEEPKLTAPQAALLKLLKEKVSKKESISRDEMIEFYISNVKRNPIRFETGWTWDDSIGKYVRDTSKDKITIWKDYWNIKAIAIQWFKLNLGAVIIKGKVLIIPVIEV